jgi:hypothetical protein
MRRWTLLLATALLACGDAPPTVTGSWSGTISRPLFPVQVSLQLAEDKGTVTGSGSFASALDRIAVTVRGTHTERQVALTLSSTGYYDISYAAQLAADGLTLDGTLSGSGFLGERLVLTRAATTRSLVAP